MGLGMVMIYRARTNPHVRRSTTDFVKEVWANLMNVLLDERKREALKQWVRRRASGLGNKTGEQQVSDDAKEDSERGNPFA